MDVKTKRFEASKEELQEIFDAAFRGLEGDALALVAGFDPVEFDLLCQSDERVRRAIKYGKGMSEAQLSGAAHDKALIEKDIRALMFLLTTKHGWKSASVENDKNIVVTVKNALPDPEIEE
jgi:hypothetical protein